MPVLVYTLAQPVKEETTEPLLVVGAADHARIGGPRRLGQLFALLLIGVAVFLVAANAPAAV